MTTVCVALHLWPSFSLRLRRLFSGVPSTSERRRHRSLSSYNKFCIQGGYLAYKTYYTRRGYHVELVGGIKDTAVENDI